MTLICKKYLALLSSNYFREAKHDTMSSRRCYSAEPEFAAESQQMQR